MRKINPVPGRRGWHLGNPIRESHEVRAALEHVETKLTMWVYGDTYEDRVLAAQKAVDDTYERRWKLLADLIEQGDSHGPNVWMLIESQDAGATASRVW